MAKECRKEWHRFFHRSLDDRLVETVPVVHPVWRSM